MNADLTVAATSMLEAALRLLTTDTAQAAAEWAGAAGIVGLQIAACVLVADFLSGVVHWLEDSYFNAKTPVIGKWLIEPNLLHHRDPRAMVKTSWWDTNVPLLLIAAAIIGITIALGVFHWWIGLTVAVLSHGAEFHRWAHRSRTENGRFIVWLQQNGVVQSPAHHAGHHRHDKDRHYCTITNYVNPVLDGVRFWRGLEAVIWAVTGVSRRPEPEGEHEHERERETDRQHARESGHDNERVGITKLALPQACNKRRELTGSKCGGRCAGCPRRAG
jgi:hypothetical protein